MSDMPVADFVPQIRSWRPRLPVIVTSTRRNLITALDAAKSGAFDYIPKPFEVEDVTAAARRAMSHLLTTSASKDRGRPVREEGGVQIVGRSEAMQKVYRAIARLVGYDLTVLVVGESGAGKELVAHALHDHGTRASGRFVIVHGSNALGDRFDAESDTFGKFVEADGGTIYFDEVSDLPAEAQTRLLHIVDGSAPIINPQTGRPVNMRIIASANRDLKALIRQGKFREDLYFRLNIASIVVPPLRDRKEDIPELVQAFLQQAVRQGLPARVLDPSSLERLKAHDWPGNVRELEAVIRRTCVMADSDVITGRMIDLELTDPVAAHEAEPEPESLSSLVERHLSVNFLEQIEGANGNVNLFDQITREMQRPFLQLSMDFARGNQVHAAKMLGLNRNTLRKKMQELGVQSKRLSSRGIYAL
jgi:two-component system nitrogen regulation response regulator GlnG